MSDQKQCPQCGANLPAETPEELCPACLLRRGFETRTAGGAAAANVLPPTPEALASRFPQLEIVELLGRGGMGVVYKARHRGLDRWVALKILPAAADRDPAFAERFSREARALAKLDHPNIVKVFDSGEADGLYYFIMEYVDGANLRQVLTAGGMKPEQALAIVPQICEALQYAHDQGIVHRDIKPENILVDKSGRVKIADFGLAKIVGLESHDFTLTGAGEMMGTPAYMAPEQVEHPSTVDHRADIYSLGVVFYQMLTGELPLGRFAPPSRKVQIDVRLDEVVLRTLEKEPGLRYQQAGELKTEVETIAGTPGSTKTEGLKANPWNAPVNYRSKTTLFGLPLIHITQGVDPATGRILVARGIIAIGDIAQGVIAIGGCAMGGIACGGVALGVISFGGLALGLVVFGGLALALLGAWGGLALAPVAMGGAAIGYLAQGGWAGGAHVWDSITKDPVAVQFFQGSWLQQLSNRAQIASSIFGFVIFAIGTGAMGWAKAREGRRAGRKTPGWWLRLAGALLLLALFGVNIAVTWTAVYQRHTKPSPASQVEKSLKETRAILDGNAPAVMQQVLNVLRTDGKAAAVSRFLETDWGARPLFIPTSALSLTEDQLAKLTAAERLKLSSEISIQVNDLRILEAAVERAGLDAAAEKDFEKARKIFESLKRCGRALDTPDAMLVVRLLGQAMEKKAVAELAKLPKANGQFPAPETSQVVRQALETISQCAEGDPRIATALNTLRSLEPSQVVLELVPFLDSPVPTIRRSAIYILYVGGLKPIDPAVAPLQKLLSHSEDYTRGMAAAALGTNRVTSSFDALASMAKNDASGYARRSAVAALGLLGDERAIPVLKAAQSDADPSVRENANDALARLEGSKTGSTEVPAGANAAGQQNAEATTHTQSATTKNPSFAPVIERVVTAAIDFDSGKLADLPEPEAEHTTIAQDVLYAVEWMKREGMDAILETSRAFAGFGMKVEILKSDAWENMTVEQLSRTLESASSKTYQQLNPGDKTPATYAFQTREGGMGILQVIGFTEKPNGVKIRYKLVQNEVKLPATPPSPKPARSTAPIPSPAASESAEELKKRAVAFVDLLAKGDFAKAHAEFDATMTAAMPEQTLATVWAQLEAAGGKYQGHDTPRLEVIGAFTAVYVPCRWERNRVDLKVVYGKDGKVTGLWAVPPGASISKPSPTGK